MAKQRVVEIPGNRHGRLVFSPRARAVGIDTRTLRRALVLIERHERLANAVQQMADDAAAGIRQRGNRLQPTQLSQWQEERDTFRDDAQLFRSDVRGMRRVLRLALRGRFTAAQKALTGDFCEPWDRLVKILGPAVERGLQR